MWEEGTCQTHAARKRHRQSQDMTLPGQAGATSESRYSCCCTQLPARFYCCKRLEKSHSNVEQFALVRREQRILQKHVYRAVVESGSGWTAHVLRRVPQPAGLPPGVTNFSMNADRFGKLSFISYLVLKGGGIFTHTTNIITKGARFAPQNCTLFVSVLVATLSVRLSPDNYRVCSHSYSLLPYRKKRPLGLTPLPMKGPDTHRSVMVQASRGELVWVNPTTPAEGELAPRCVKQGIIL